MLDQIVAPWSDEQVDALNRFQKLDHIHPFTCPNTHTLPCPCTENKALTPDRHCFRCLGGGMVMTSRDLIATNDGWVCPYCDYKQSWAHAVMLEEWPNPMKVSHPQSQEKG